MNRVEKFALAKALHDSSPMEGLTSAIRQWQWTLCLNAVANVACRGYDEGVAFRTLANRDNWLPQDNPFTDDA